MPEGWPDLFTGRVGEAVAPGVHRVLVDRLWPRGVAKARAPWDTWLKDVAPSTALRTWYAHDPARWGEFAERYRQELTDEGHRAAVVQLRAIWRRNPVMLVTATRNIDGSQVPVLQAFLQDS